MVIFDQDHVKKAHSMVSSTPAGNRVFLQPAPSWRGFAGIQNAGMGSFDGLDKLGRERGDAGQALEKVQSDTLRTQQGSSGAGECYQILICKNVVSVIRYPNNPDTW